MYIVLDKDNTIEQLRSKYLLLELDTMEFLGETPIVSYAVITSEGMTIQELQVLQSLRELHEGLMRNYHKQDWNFCKQALEQLSGKFKGEIDTFYADLESRIGILETSQISSEWTGNVIVDSE